VITAAASIMIAVFIAFAFMGQRSVAEFGIGLAAAVALDAFVLRTVLVPAVMYLSGRANWWLPRWLDRRLPHLAMEAPAEEPPTRGGVGRLLLEQAVAAGHEPGIVRAGAVLSGPHSNADAGSQHPVHRGRGENP
jgi:uncharacterized membrane protein YdfJ with MMPL/SSD domain